MKEPAATTTPPPAGLGRRLAAAGYDLLLLLAVWFLGGAIALALNNGVAIAPGNPWFSSWLFLLTWGFYGWFWTHGGQTLGMRAWRIQLRTREGQGVNWSQSLLRLLAAIVSVAALGLGWLWMLVDRDRLTWHDRFSLTRVVHLP